MPKLLRNINDNYWVVEINPNLKYVSTQEIKKGIIWQWGKDTNGKFKLMYAYYPKTYSDSDMDRILTKYFNCPNCKIGRDNLKFDDTFKYKKKKYKLMKNMEMIKNKLNNFVGSENAQTILKEWGAQGAAAGIRTLIQMVFKTPVEKIISLLLGIGGTAGTVLYDSKKGFKKNLTRDLLLSHFANWGTNSLDPSPSGAMEVIDGLSQLKSAIKSKSNYANSIFRSPDELRNVAAKAKMLLGNGYSKARGFWSKLDKKGRFRGVPTTHSPKKVFGGEIAQSSDFGYDDNSQKWFRSSSNFSPNFLNMKRFRQSGQDVY